MFYLSMPPLTRHERAMVAKRLARKGWTVKDISESMGRSISTVRRYIKS